MQQDTPNKTNKTTRRPRCKHCRKQFRTTSIKAIFCTRTCKDKATATKRRIKYVERATDSAFFKQLAFEASRAGTLEIFTGHTAESLAELYKLYAFRLKANQYGKSTDYELSHISAAQGEDSVGLYHPLNLVVAPKPLNRAHGNQHFGHGLSVARRSLKSRYTVERGANQKETAARIIQFIGPDIVAQAVKLAGIKPSARNTALAWLRDHLDPTVSEHRDWLDGLDAMQTPALKALRAMLEGKEVNGYIIKTRNYTCFEVLLVELERQAQYRPDLGTVVDVIYHAVKSYIATTCSSDFLGDRSFSDIIRFMPEEFMTEVELQAVFDVLHGKEVDAIRPVLEAFAERHSGAVERIPPYKPIVFRVHRPAKALATGERSEATLQAPVSFAAELDAIGEQDTIPVLLLSHATTYGNDSLPWA